MEMRAKSLIAPKFIELGAQMPRLDRTQTQSFDIGLRQDIANEIGQTPIALFPRPQLHPSEHDFAFAKRQTTPDFFDDIGARHRSLAPTRQPHRAIRTRIVAPVFDLDKTANPRLISRWRLRHTRIPRFIDRSRYDIGCLRSIVSIYAHNSKIVISFCPLAQVVVRNRILARLHEIDGTAHEHEQPRPCDGKAPHQVSRFAHRIGGHPTRIEHDDIGIIGNGDDFMPLIGHRSRDCLVFCLV